MALGVPGHGASRQDLASETPVTATAPSSAVSSRRFLLWLYLVGFLVSARTGAGEKHQVSADLHLPQVPGYFTQLQPGV